MKSWRTDDLLFCEISMKARDFMMMNGVKPNLLKIDRFSWIRLKDESAALVAKRLLPKEMKDTHFLGMEIEIIETKKHLIAVDRKVL